MFGNVQDNVSRAEEVVAAAEEKFDASGADEDLMALNRAQVLLNQHLAEEELFWKQAEGRKLKD